MFSRNKPEEMQKDFDIFAMFDSKVGAYEMPMFAMNEHDMTREIMNVFQDSKNHSSNKYFLNAEDYSLFRIGYYSKKQGKLYTHNAEHVVNLHDLKNVVTQKMGIGPT